MTKREDLLSRAWTGEQLTIGGKPVIMSPVRYSILEYWHNSLFDSTNTNQSAVDAMGEMLLLCSATREELKDIQRLAADERKIRVMEFMIDTEDEFTLASSGIQERLDSIRAAMVESESPGKEDAPAHAF